MALRHSSKICGNSVPRPSQLQIANYKSNDRHSKTLQRAIIWPPITVHMLA